MRFSRPPTDHRRLLLAVPIALALCTHSTYGVPRDPVRVYCRAQASWQQQLAAREVCRYLYVRTGQLPELVTALPESGDAIILGTVGDAPVAALLGEAPDAERDPLGAQSYRLQTIRRNDRRALLIVGGDDLGVLYGAYRFAELLGVRFYLHGDALPDERLADWQLPEINETHTPLFELRGIQPFHDFCEGPDWWNLDDYKAYLSQLAKLRMNFLGLHCYPEGGVGPEPLVWIGLPQDMDETGRVTFSYPSRWASTAGGAWGYDRTKTSDFSAGAALLFDRDDFGPDVTEGHRPKPSSLAGSNEVFNRAATLYGAAFRHGRALGVKFCVGTETPLTIPAALKQRLTERGFAPNDEATVRKLYEGIFTRIARALPVDYYWLWTPEGWTWSGVSPEQVEATIRDIESALAALENVGKPFDLATCGWVLGPPSDRSQFDKILPKHVALSCINRDVGFDPVEPGFSAIEGRPQWAIPWLEDDPAMIIPQLWVGRMRRDAADALAYGCNGLMGIHWRTRVLGPNVSALAQAAWDQTAWNPGFGERVDPPKPLTTDVHVGGSTADYSHSPIAETDDDRVYQTCRWNVDAYRVAVPNGTYAVTLEFCEVHYREPEKRVFGVRIEGRDVIESLDVFARVGQNAALDFTFQDVTVDDEELTIEFVRQVEYPFIAGIVIEGQTAGANQEPGARFTRRINCGGGAVAGYEADLPAVNTVPGFQGRPRDLPADDFYADWARAEFGAEVAEPLAKLFAGLDGSPGDGAQRASRLPRPADWDRGPGGIKPNRTPWEVERARYAFVDELAAFRSRVVGAGNLERFDYWLNTFRYLRAIGELGCARGRLDALVEQIQAADDATRKAELARAEAMPVRLELARLWEQAMTLLVAVVSTPGELGTVANLEQHVRRHNAFLSLHDKLLTELLGTNLPPEAEPGPGYQGSARIVVPTVRSAVSVGERLTIKVIVLAGAPAAKPRLHWRALGDERFWTIDLNHVDRAAYTAALPPARGVGLEYYVTATTTDGQELVWPATAPRLGQTVVVAPAGQPSGQ